jgi:hypothetical protein
LAPHPILRNRACGITINRLPEKSRDKNPQQTAATRGLSLDGSHFRLELLGA